MTPASSSHGPVDVRADGHIEPLLDAGGAAELLSVPPSWVLSEARADRIPHVRLGRYVRFERDELVAWWRARAQGPTRRTGTRPVSNGRSSQ